MFCSKCGREIKEGSKFCNVCGAKQIIPDFNNQNNYINQTQPVDMGFSQPNYGNQTQPVNMGFNQPNYGNQTQPVNMEFNQPNYGNQTQPVNMEFSQPNYGNQTQPVNMEFSQPNYGNQTQPVDMGFSQPNYGNQPKVENPSGKKKGLIIGGSIAAILIIAVVIILVVLNPFEKKSDNSTSKDRDSDRYTSEDFTEPDTQGVTEIEDTTEDTTEAVTSDETLYVYTYNSEFSNYLEYFYDKYPEYRGRIEICEYNDQNELIEKVNENLYGDENPSIVVYDLDNYSEFFDDSKYCSMDEIGLSDSDMADFYPYTKELLTYNGKVMGVCPYVCPGGFMYNADIANEVFGTSDPDVIGAYFTSWDGVLEAANLLKQKGYYLVPETQCVARSMGNNYNQTVIDNIINNGYSKEVSEWTEEWYDCFKSDTFGIFGTSWFVYSYANSYEEELVAVPIGVCTTPDAYIWGGTVYGVAKSCPDKELAGLILYEICCDYDTASKIANEKGNMVNNISVIEDFISNGDYPEDWYYLENVSITTNFFKVFDEIAKRYGE